MRELVITAVGRDRPGIVGRLTAPIYRAEANVADSRMVNLRGRFAIILLAEVADDRLAALQAELRAAAEELSLELSYRDEAMQPEEARAVGVPYQLKTHAMDQPGLVHLVTHRLQEHGVNVEEMTTRAQPRPQTGAPLFSMDLRITVPTNVSLKTLRNDLEQLCDELNCDIELVRAGVS